MPRRSTGWAKVILEFSVGIVIVACFSYLVARNALGNPFAGLGEEGQLNSTVELELSRIYGLDTPPLIGLFRFLRGLATGDTGRSMFYGYPAFQLTMHYALWTLTAVTIGFAMSLLFTILWFLYVGPGAGPTFFYRKLSFIPGYIYAVPVVLATWYTGWPSPLPGVTLGKMAVYALIVFLAASSRLIHGLMGMVEDQSIRLDDYKLFLQAIGFPDSSVNWKVLRIVLPSFTAYSTALMGSILERSVVLEPLIGYTGVGMIVYEGVLNADPILAATAFFILGLLGYLFVAVGRVIEPLLDPRMRDDKWSVGI